MDLPHGDKLRFLVAGAATTLVSYVLYWLLLWQAMPPKPAYAIAYVAGIVMSYALSSQWVFKRGWTHFGLLSFAIGYGVQALVSYGVFLLILEFTPVPAWLAPVLVTILLLPLSFLMNRELVHRTSPAPDPRTGVDP